MVFRFMELKNSKEMNLVEKRIWYIAKRSEK